MKVIFFANTDWYLYNFRRSLALAVRDRGDELLLLSPAGRFGASLRLLGLRWEAVSMDRRSLNPFRELVLLWQLVRIMRRERPTLVHSFTIKCAVYGSIAARLARVPTRVNSVAGMGYVFTNDGMAARFLRGPLRLLMRLALGGPNARLILQNQDDVALFHDATLVPAESIRLIKGSGVDCERFRPSSAQDSDRPLRVLLPARLLWDKGIKEYVGAAREIRAAGRAVEFLLAGTSDAGNPAAIPSEKVREWNDEGVLHWLGHVDDMPGLLASVDVVVLPSYREGLPKGLIEGGACGKALVTTDVPGCREVVNHEVDGLLIPVRDASALAQAIGRLADDSALRGALGSAARDRALAEFDEAIVIKKTLTTYNELVAQSL